MITFLVLAVAGGAWFVRRPAPAERPILSSQPAMRIRQTAIILRHRGEKQVELRADRVEVSRDLNRVVLTGIANAVIYDAGSVASQVRADAIVLDRRTDDFSAQGHIEVSGLPRDGRSVPSSTGQLQQVGAGRLHADRIRYLARDKVFIAEGNVLLVLGDVEIRAQRLRLERVPQIAYLSGDVLVVQPGSSLRAEAVRYDIQRRVAHASGDVMLVQGETAMRAQQAYFDLAEQHVTAEGSVVVTQRDVTVSAPHLIYDAKTKDVSADGGVRLDQGRSVLTAQALQANLDTRRAEAKGKVRLVRAPGRAEGQDALASALAAEETVIEARQMAFRWDVGEATAEGDVVIKQPDKTARAQRGVYSETVGRIELQGAVVVEQISGEWLVKGGVVEPPKDEPGRKALASKTTLTCERLVILLKERDMRAEGRVTVTQPGRSASGNQAAYTHKDGRLVLSGNVQLVDEDGSRLRADQVIFSLADETFEAVGSVDTEFTVQRGK